jgi:hypothetical protein
MLKAEFGKAGGGKLQTPKFNIQGNSKPQSPVAVITREAQAENPGNLALSTSNNPSIIGISTRCGSRTRDPGTGAAVTLFPSGGSKGPADTPLSFG